MTGLTTSRARAMGKLRELRDYIDQVDRRHEQSVKAVAIKLDRHARKVTTDLNRESQKIAQRVVKLEKRITVLERRLQKRK